MSPGEPWPAGGQDTRLPTPKHTNRAGGAHPHSASHLPSASLLHGAVVSLPSRPGSREWRRQLRPTTAKLPGWSAGAGGEGGWPGLAPPGAPLHLQEAGGWSLPCPGDSTPGRQEDPAHPHPGSAGQKPLTGSRCGARGCSWLRAAAEAPGGSAGTVANAAGTVANAAAVAWQQKLRPQASRPAPAIGRPAAPPAPPWPMGGPARTAPRRPRGRGRSRFP